MQGDTPHSMAAWLLLGAIAIEGGIKWLAQQLDAQTRLDPAEQQFTDAACCGGVNTVLRMLRQQEVTVASIPRSRQVALVESIATVGTTCDALDRNLAGVLRVLGDAGWPLVEVRTLPGENALHMLASQPRRHAVEERAQTIVDWVRRQRPRLDNALAAHDMRGRMPEQCVSFWDGKWRLASTLRKARGELALACKRDGLSAPTAPAARTAAAGAAPAAAAPPSGSVNRTARVRRNPRARPQATHPDGRRVTIEDVD
eukprot:jgi/Ulvmu1/7394/UM036_0054.1